MAKVAIYIDGTGDGRRDKRLAAMGDDYSVFINNISNIQQNVPVFFAVDLWKFDGAVLATCEVTARFLNSCPQPLQRYTLSDTIGDVEHVDSVEEFLEKVKS